MSTLLPWWARAELTIRTRARTLGTFLILTGGLWFLMEAMRPGAWGGQVDGWVNLLCMLTAVMMSTALVSEDFRSGRALLWLQRPVNPTRHYLKRFGEAVVAWTAACVGFFALGILSVWVSATPSEYPLFMGFPRVWLTGLCIGALAFGLGTWLFRGGGILAIAGWIAGVYIEGMVPPNALVQTIIHVFTVPNVALRPIGEFVVGEITTFPTASLLHALAFAAGWLAVGILGVRVATRSGLARGVE